MKLDFKSWFAENASNKDFDEEMEFARKMIAREVQIEGFSYYKDYVTTIAKEAQVIKGKCLFIGGGPVPLTPILLQKNHGIACDIMEYSSQAIEIAHKVLDALGMRIKMILADATHFSGYGQYGTIILALEAGPTESTKRAIFENMKTQITPKTELIIRGSNANEGDEGFPSVEHYVGSYFKVAAKIPVFGNLSTTYILHCNGCPTPPSGISRQPLGKGLPSHLTASGTL